MILTILKVIGIILLMIVALLLWILGSLLFIPIRYQFAGTYQNMAEGDACIRWTPLWLKIFAKMKDGKVEYTVYLFGGIIMTNTDAKVSWLGRKLFSDKDENGEEKSEEERINAKQTEEEQESIAKQQLEVKEEQKDIQPKKKKEGCLDTEKKEKTKKQHKKSIKTKIKKQYAIFLNKLKRVKKKKEAFIQLFRSKRFTLAKNDVILYIKEIFSIIKPDKLKGYIKFGFEDPATTGQVLGGVSIALSYYYKFLDIEPDFTRNCFEGKVKGKGKIFLFSVVKLLVKVMLNKNLIKVVKKVQTIIEA